MMSDLLPYFQMVDDTFWGDDVYRWWFYAAIILILLLERSKRLANSQMVKRVFAVYPICFILALFNPITYTVTKYFTGGGWAYYARLYSMLPIPYTLALGSILLMDRIVELPRKGNWARNRSRINLRNDESIQKTEGNLSRLLKLHFTIGICVLIVLGGTDVYSQDWMKPAQNIAKVPNEVLELIQELKQFGGVSVAVPEELSSYFRQVDATFYTPYGRHVNSLGQEISKADPDVSFIMNEAGKQAVDYIVVARNPDKEVSFIGLGYEPEALTENYAIYAVSKVPRIVRVMNEKHQIVEQDYLNADGQLECTAEGYAAVLFEYDKYGNQRKETFLDEKKEKIEIDRGYTSVCRGFRSLSTLINSIYYLDSNDNKILHEGCYETRYEYNNSRRVIRESYYDADGKLMNRTDVLYASKKLTRNKDERIIKEEYFDKEGNPVLSSSGFAACTREYNETGRITKEIFYSIDGNPVLLTAGYAGYIRKFDERGNLTSESYLGTTGKIAARNTGYAQVQMEYDELNRLVIETYWDENEEPYTIANGSHGFMREYDETGNGYIEIYIDTNGQETALQNGYSRVQREYDEKKQLISEQYFYFTEPFNR